MPKPTAIKLSRKTAPIIAEALDIPIQDVEMELCDSLSHYYVTNCFLRDLQMPYMIYGEYTFLEDFASVPPGIEDNFVPVTQIKE